MSSRSFLVLISAIIFFRLTADGQKIHPTNERKLVIDTTMLMPGLSKAQIFNNLKKWAILKMTNYNDMLKGEVDGSLIKLLDLTDYWAAGGTKQTYSQDVTFEINEGKIYVKIDNLKTYVEEKGVRPIDRVAMHGYPADKFFINKDGELKKYPKFYSDVNVQFRERMINLVQAVNPSNILIK
jgi:hypothetical protein